jgi:tetratricopeptide (TPR) repeat protein
MLGVFAPPTHAPTVETVLARERAAVHFENGEFAAARADLAPLVAVARPELEDLVRAAIVDFAERAKADPEPFFARIRALDPDNPELNFMQARIALENGDFEAARKYFQIVHDARPDDLPTRVGLAQTLDELDRSDEARALLADVIAVGEEKGGVWLTVAVYRLMQLESRAGRRDEAARLQQVFEQFQKFGYRPLTLTQFDQGELARLRPPRPHGVAEVQAPHAPQFTAEPAIAPEFAGARELFVHDLDGDGTADFLAAGPRGLFAALHGAQGYSVEKILDGAVDHVRAFDLGNRDSLDLIVVRGTEVLLLEHRSGGELVLGDPNASLWSPSPLQFPRFPSPPADLTLVDFDHDGDLDLLIVGAFGARMYRNDGAAPRTDARGQVVRGSFVDVSLETSLPADAEITWCTTEDFDNDTDVDLLLGGPRALVLLDNHRSGKFEDIAARVFGSLKGLALEPVIADFDADGRPDLFEPGAPSSLRTQREDGSFAEPVEEPTVPDGASLRVIDLDLDGIGDLFWSGASAAIEGALAFGTPSAVRASIAGSTQPSARLVFADLDRDLDNDFARATDAGLEIFRCQGPVGHAARFEPLGLKDNRRAVGAVIEARTRGLYRRIYWRGEPELVGCGPYDKIDVARTTWPNGSVQPMLDVAPTDRPFVDTPARGLIQSGTLIGSCPFLYTWNGTKFVFVSDVLGVTPLGLPIAPGMLVPPDHDEYVRVRGDQLVEHDGVLEMQFTEELREVTYLDRARLDVIDHPAGSEIYPNERFTLPPFPEPHIHTVQQPLSPTRVTGSDGVDWTQALAAVDDVHAAPFAPLEPQFLGLATPHWLELEFDPERVRGAKRLRLVCTGWFFWTDASVNMASARTPGVEFVPPILQLPGPDGAWHDAGPPLGFPAGKSKTMVIDVSDVLDREHPKLRLFSTLRLYWDAIQLAVDADDAPTRVTPIEPRGARLWPRGFSRAIDTDRSDLPERFDWDELAPEPRWNQHPGRYTRYGETVELLGAVDDRFVILGSGDALTLRFDAKELPALPEGWVRDYLLFLDGWAKDRDPNTIEALAVEPLPFHAMSGYPYGPGESFPRTPALDAWRVEWNTREARRWIAPLAPRGTDDWARAVAAEARSAK